MNLRPRYSLLSLLVVTALVAGGVKLWYGPHHVVEGPMNGIEAEYTFTRDLLGNKTLQGPCTVRFFRADSSLSEFRVFYIRQGIKLDWQYTYSTTPSTERAIFSLNDQGWSASPLNEKEYSKFLEAIKIEVMKLPLAFPRDIKYAYEGSITR